jgi:hypothetical protein
MQTTQSIKRTSTGLKEALFEELDSLRNGESNPAKSNAIAKLATQVVNICRIEIDVQKHITSTRDNSKTIDVPGVALCGNSDTP